MISPNLLLVVYVLFFAVGIVLLGRSLLRRDWIRLSIWAVVLMSGLIGIGAAVRGVAITYNGF